MYLFDLGLYHGNIRLKGDSRTPVFGEKRERKVGRRREEEEEVKRSMLVSGREK
jgi:hypothetical protein